MAPRITAAKRGMLGTAGEETALLSVTCCRAAEVVRGERWRETGTAREREGGREREKN